MSSAAVVLINYVVLVDLDISILIDSNIPTNNEDSHVTGDRWLNSIIHQWMDADAAAAGNDTTQSTLRSLFQQHHLVRASAPHFIRCDTTDFCSHLSSLSQTAKYFEVEKLKQLPRKLSKSEIQHVYHL